MQGFDYFQNLASNHSWVWPPRVTLSQSRHKTQKYCQTHYLWLKQHKIEQPHAGVWYLKKSCQKTTLWDEPRGQGGPETQKYLQNILQWRKQPQIEHPYALINPKNPISILGPRPPWTPLVYPPENSNLGQKTPKLEKLDQKLCVVKVSAKSVEKKVNLPTNDFTGRFV